MAKVVGFRVTGVVVSGLWLASCGTLLGLDDYEVGKTGATSAGGSAGEAGELTSTGGSGGDTSTSSTSTATTTDNTAAGGNSSGGASSTSTTSSGGSAGAAGAGRDTCETSADCVDRSECRLGSCDDGQCVFNTAPAGTVCAAGFCNGVEGNEGCFACADDAAGSEVDSGCSSGAPECRVDDAGAYGCAGCNGPADCDDDNDCTTDSCSDGVCAQTSTSPGSTCSSGVCNGAETSPLCLPCLDDAAGLETDTGCTDDTPICLSDVGCAECSGDGDCDDMNSCTLNQCDAGTCTFATVNAGAPCIGQSGVCNGVAGNESCGACVDTAAGTNVDQGCGSGAPVCNDAVQPSVCSGCIMDGDCNDGIACTVDSCSTGQCVNTPNDGMCDSVGTACDPYRCTSNEDTADGCEVVSDRYYQSLLTNGDLELGVSGWTEEGEYVIIDEPPTGISPYSGTLVAWLGEEASNPNTTYDDALWQVVSVPSDADELGLVLHYYVDSADVPNAIYDEAFIELRSNTGTNPTHQFATWSNIDHTAAWLPFEATYDLSGGEAGQAVSLYFRSSNDNLGITYFFFDAISLNAVCCGAPCN